jgi:hypothetical protein
MPIDGLSKLFNAKARSHGRNITFTSVCMDCGAVLGTQTVHRDDPDAPDETSHGICPACLAKRMAELDAEEEKK